MQVSGRVSERMSGVERTSKADGVEKANGASELSGGANGQVLYALIL